MNLSEKYLSILHRFASLQALVLASGAALLLLLGVVVAIALHFEYRNDVDIILSSGERTAQKLAVRTSEVLDSANRSTLLVKHLAENDQKVTLQSLHRAGLLADEVIRLVLIADAKGFIGDSTSDLVPINISDDDSFKAHQRAADLDVTVGVAEPLHLAGGWGIPVSRRLNGPDGEFAGLVVAAIDPKSLLGDFDKGEATDSAMGVLGMDGIFRSRKLGGQVTFGDKVDIASLQERMREIRKSRRPTKSRIDGVERFLSVVRVDRYPMLATVAINADSALAGYRHARFVILSWATVVALLIVACAAMLCSKVTQLEHSRQETRQAEAALRATVEGSLDAVCIMRAQRDSSGGLIDFLVVDCNVRAAALIGRTRSEVVGQRLCALAPSIRTNGFLERFGKVIATGVASEAELQATEWEVAGRWLHHRVVPMGDGMALITRDVTARKEAEQTLAGLVQLDSLTKLGNRRYFEQHLQDANDRALRSGQALALVFIDLDGFKAINDTFGHAAGDKLLVSVAERLRKCVRITDRVSRLGGDEFVIVVEGGGTAQHVSELCGRIVASLSDPHEIDGKHLVSTPSLGAAILQNDESLESLQGKADAAMYEAKRAGKARFRLAGADFADQVLAEPLVSNLA